MYVHIGGDYQVPARTILSILDIDQESTLEAGSINQLLLQQAERENRVEMVAVDVPRSLIITLERLYLSPIAAATLRKRLKEVDYGK